MCWGTLQPHCPWDSQGARRGQLPITRGTSASWPPGRTCAGGHGLGELSALGTPCPLSLWAPRRAGHSHGPGDRLQRQPLSVGARGRVRPSEQGPPQLDSSPRGCQAGGPCPSGPRSVCSPARGSPWTWTRGPRGPTPVSLVQVAVGGCCSRTPITTLPECSPAHPGACLGDRAPPLCACHPVALAHRLWGGGDPWSPGGALPHAEKQAGQRRCGLWSAAPSPAGWGVPLRLSGLAPVLSVTSRPPPPSLTTGGQGPERRVPTWVSPHSPTLSPEPGLLRAPQERAARTWGLPHADHGPETPHSLPGLPCPSLPALAAMGSTGRPPEPQSGRRGAGLTPRALSWQILVTNMPAAGVDGATGLCGLLWPQPPAAREVLGERQGCEWFGGPSG